MRSIGGGLLPLLDKVHCPVLALNGTKDTQVECRSNLGALEAGLPADGSSCIEAVDGVNHMFQHCATGATIEYREIEETFSPEVLQKIITWIEVCSPGWTNKFSVYQIDPITEYL